MTLKLPAAPEPTTTVKLRIKTSVYDAAKAQADADGRGFTPEDILAHNLDLLGSKRARSGAKKLVEA